MDKKEVMPMVDILAILKPIFKSEDYERYSFDPDSFQDDFCECFRVATDQRIADLAILEAERKWWRKKVEQARKEGYEESVKRAIDLAIFNVPYACKFGGIPERLLGIVIPEMNIVELRNPAPEVSDDKKDPRD